MKRILSICLVSLVQTISFAQGKQDANWVFGNNVGISFVDTAHPSNFKVTCNDYEAAASISDTGGHLLFYLAPNNMASLFSSYYAIYDSSGNKIGNGDSILMKNGYTLTNGAVFIPVIGQDNQFILLTLSYTDSLTYWWQSLYATKIEKDSLGNYRVINKNQLVLNRSSEEALTIIKHANGKDWWVVTHSASIENPTDGINVLLIEGDSIYDPVVYHIGSYHYPDPISGVKFAGEIVSSRKGDLIASLGTDQDKIDLMHFDRCSGEVTYVTTLNDVAPKDSIGGTITFYSCEFSPDGSKLYATCFGETTGTNNLYQFRLDTSDIPDSKKLVWLDTIPSYQHNFGQLQVAADNKIYLANLSNNCCPYATNYYSTDNQFLWVINEPDSNGSSCDFQPYALYLGDSSRTYLGLPNMPNYNLGPISVYAANAGQDATFCKDTVENVTLGVPAVPNVVYHWQPSDGLNDTSIAQPTADPDTDTFYVLTMVDTSQTGTSCDTRTDTVFVHVVQKCRVGISEISGQSIKVYPNPASTQLVVEVPPSNGGIFRLYDVVGRLVVEKKLQDTKTAINVSSLPPGLYIYRLGQKADKVQIAK